MDAPCSSLSNGLRHCLLFVCAAVVFLAASIDASTVGDDCSGGAAVCNTAGQYCQSSDNTCQLVPAGSYSDGSGIEVSCGTGYTSTGSGSSGSSAQFACVCALGYGRLSNDNSVACAPCAVGTYKAATDDTACDIVAAGYYASVDGVLYASQLLFCALVSHVTHF